MEEENAIDANDIKESIKNNIESFNDIGDLIKDLKDSELRFGARYYLWWPDGSELGFNYMRISGGDPAEVRSLGFKAGTFVFWRMTKKKRHQYLEKIKKVWNSTLKFEKIKKICKTYRKIKDIPKLEEMDDFLEKQLDDFDKNAEKAYDKFNKGKLEKPIKIESTCNSVFG